MTRFADVAGAPGGHHRRPQGRPTRRRSYTAKLLAGGLDRAAKKLGEEAVETVIAAAQGDPDALAAESADLIYHWLVLLAASGVSLDEVAEKLEAREGQSGIEEKASRS